MAAETVVGVNLTSEGAFLGVLGRPFGPVIDTPVKVLPAANVGEWKRVKQFGEDVVVAARAHHATCVVFADPRVGMLSYSNALERISLQTAASLALCDAGIEVRRVHARTAASALGFASIKPMDAGIANLLGLKPDKVVHWSQRLPAFAVAAAVARDKWP
jgi:hypothetical protein